MAVRSKIKAHFDAMDFFKELPFYNKPIEKPKVKSLKNIDRLKNNQALSLVMQRHIKLK